MNRSTVLSDTIETVTVGWLGFKGTFNTDRDCYSRIQLLQCSYYKICSHIWNQIKLQTLGGCTPPTRHVLPVSWSRSLSISGSPYKFNHFVHWPTANFPWKFHANPSGSFCAKLLTDRQTNRQTTAITYPPWQR